MENAQRPRRPQPLCPDALKYAPLKEPTGLSIPGCTKSQDSTRWLYLRQGDLDFAISGSSTLPQRRAKNRSHLTVAWPIKSRRQRRNVRPTTHANVRNWPRWNGHRPPFGGARVVRASRTERHQCAKVELRNNHLRNGGPK